MSRATRLVAALGTASMLTVAALFASCAEGGRVVGQRTFLWHAGDATSSSLPADVANPFRGRVAPAKPRHASFAANPLGGLALIGATDPETIRHFQGDPTFLGDPADPSLDPLDPELARILHAPASVLVASIQLDGTFTIPFGTQPLSATFPADFGGDFSGEVFCVHPRSFEAAAILNGQTPGSGSRCIRGSVDTNTNEIYTWPSIVRMTGGSGEAPFRPAPDRASLDDPAGNDGSEAQGLLYPTRGMRSGTAMHHERNVDPATGRPLVARTGAQDIGSCSSATAGQVSSLGVGLFHPGASVAYSTAFASHPFSVTTGVAVQNGPSPGLVRGGLGTDPGCLRPGGAPGHPNAFVDFGDGIDDAIADTNALENHPANQGLFASLCGASRLFDVGVPLASCLLTLFGSPELLSNVTRVPFSEGLAIVAAGSVSASGGNALLFTLAAMQKFETADVIAPIVPLNRLYNDPRAPLLDRNGDGLVNASGCDSPDPAERAACDLGGFDGFDGRVAVVAGEGDGFPPGTLVRDPAEIAAFNAELTVNRILDTDTVQFSYQTLDDSLTNEQRGLFGCGPIFGTRCDSSATRNPLESLGGVIPLETFERHFGPAGGIDLLNTEASASLESVPVPSDPTPVTTSDPQPGTVDFPNELLCMRRLAGGELVRLPGCRGVAGVTIQRQDPLDPTSAPVSVVADFDADYLPSVDGCVVGSRIAYEGAANGMGYVPVVIGSGGGPGLAAELALCNDAIREQVRPQYVFDRSGPLYSDLVVDAGGGYVSGGVPNLARNPDLDGLTPQQVNTECPPSGSRAAFIGPAQPGAPASGDIGVEGGVLTFRYCKSGLVRLEDLPLLHPLAGCESSEVWWEARAGFDDPDTGLPWGGCEFFHERDLVREFFEGNARLFRSETAAVSWNLLQYLVVTSCDARTPDAYGSDHASPTPVLGLRADPQCFDADRPFSPGRCSYTTPQHCRNVKALLGTAPPLAADGTAGDDDADGVTPDGDGSGVAGDAPCGTGQVLGCDDNCPDLPNRGQVNANGGGAGPTDGFGNLCDPDLDDDGDVDLDDRALQDACFTTGASSIDCAEADLVGGSLDDEPDPDETTVDGFDRLQLLRWLRDPASQPGSEPAL